ncbi:MAG TPA: hypothetical protein PLZ01_15955 [bacterium]|nr:hypothetical protein [bacterium]
MSGPQGMNKRTVAAVLAGVVVGGLVLGCHSARMAVPNELAVRSEQLICSGRGGFSEDFSFGAFQVTDVHRGWTRRSAGRLWRLEKADTQQSYEFSLAAPGGGMWNGQAAAGLQAADLKAEAWSGDLTIGIVSNQSLVVRLERSDSETWTMVLNQRSNEDLMTGYLSSKTATYEVTGTHKLAGTPMPLVDTAGYVVAKNKAPVAAVDVINDGIVWLSHGLSGAERDGLAAAAAALLLFHDLSADH